MIKTITLTRVDDDIRVTSDDDAIGTAYNTTNSTNESYQFMMALSHFLSKREIEMLFGVPKQEDKNNDRC